jgi:GT2 family glycosyltransferase
MKTSVIISYYAARPWRNLRTLLEQLEAIDCNVLIVVNRAPDGEFKAPQEIARFDYRVRENNGMNIGAWNYGARVCNKSDFLIFMQDECYVREKTFLTAYEDMMQNPKTGIVGESINEKWDRGWCQIKNSTLNYFLTNEGLTRVDYYLKALNRWGIEPGPNGRHLRSLVLGMRREVFERMDGFKEGHSKEECIAAEIGISKKAESLGLRVEQSAIDSFHFIGHQEWVSGSQLKLT